MTDYIVVLTTVPNEEEAAKIAAEIVESKLAACANIIRNIRSIYRWEGKVEDSPEVLMILKTRVDLFDSLAGKIGEIHSYSVPEIIAIPVIRGLEDYLGWIEATTENI